jgi:hypothetical protein
VTIPSPSGHPDTTTHNRLTRLLRQATDLAALGAQHLDRPWKDHALRNASTAAAALRRESEEAEEGRS